MMKPSIETCRRLRYLADLSKWTREAPKRPPQRLQNFVRACGGVQEFRGELRAIVGARGGSWGLISQYGMALDDLGRCLWEHGYIGGEERPTVADTLDALATDINNEPVYSANDWEALCAYESGEDARVVLDEMGLLMDTVAKQKRVERLLEKAAKGELNEDAG